MTIEYAPGLPEADYAVITPYLVPPGPKKVNVGDGFILDSATRLLGSSPRVALSSRVPLTDAAIEQVNATRCVIAVGANTLKDHFEPTPGFNLATLSRIQVPVIFMGIGHYGVAEVTQGLTANSQALFRAFLERFPRISLRCDASKRYVMAALPDLDERFVMTSCPVAHAVDSIDRGFKREASWRQLVVTITDRVALQQQLPLLDAGRATFPAARRILALHQDYGNAELWAYAQQRGYEVEKSANHQDLLRLYRETDIHLGNRVHAHLKCLSLGVATFCTPFDLRQAYFAESLDCPLVERIPSEQFAAYDFGRARRRRDAARATMDGFVRDVRAVIGS